MSVFDHLCVACHGLSVLVTGRAGDESPTMLFDVGPYGDVSLANAERLGVDLGSIEAIFLSHRHADHSGGIPSVVASVADARTVSWLPAPVVDVHPGRPDKPRVTAYPTRRGSPSSTFTIVPRLVAARPIERGALISHGR